MEPKPNKPNKNHAHILGWYLTAGQIEEVAREWATDDKDSAEFQTLLLAFKLLTGEEMENQYPHWKGLL